MLKASTGSSGLTALVMRPVHGVVEAHSSYTKFDALRRVLDSKTQPPARLKIIGIVPSGPLVTQHELTLHRRLGQPSAKSPSFFPGKQVRTSGGRYSLVLLFLYGNSGFHSYRSATRGSTLVARRAGSREAATATNARSPRTQDKVAGSPGLTP